MCVISWYYCGIIVPSSVIALDVRDLSMEVCETLPLIDGLGPAALGDKEKGKKRQDHAKEDNPLGGGM